MHLIENKSKILLITVAIIMLIAVGISFATWDTSAVVVATNGDSTTYADAKVGDVITFGNYYQTGERDLEDPTKYAKTPIEWIVVDKDERTGQLTLMSKYILAAGSYFSNWYYNTASSLDYHYNLTKSEIGGNPYNQAYIESTPRAFLNNLERKDLGGDSYDTKLGYKTSMKESTLAEGKLYTSIGFSNKNYRFGERVEFKRPIDNTEYKDRPATLGFYDEAFSYDEQMRIVPKVLAGYTGFRWPNTSHEPSGKKYIEGAIDKVWLPSTTELNIMAVEDNQTNPSDEASSTVFEYFKNYKQYTNPVTGEPNTTLATALKTVRTDFVRNDSKAMNYSIPVYKYQSTAINTEIDTAKNSSDNYWTRSPMSYYYMDVRVVIHSGIFNNDSMFVSYLGVRPCVTLKY